MILECCALCFSYNGHKVLNDISFKTQQGSFCAILGRNGSGKTTLIHCLNKILTPASGQILLHGRDITSFSRSDIARQISLVPQEHLDIFPYKVIDVIIMGRAPFLKIAESPGENDYEIGINALKELNIEHLANKNFNRISGGERQITLLARALAQTTKIMLLDEPTNHLDFNNQYHLLSSIKKLCESKGLNIIASMHDPNMAAVFADNVIMIKNGKIMVQGGAQSVMNQENISKLYDTDASEIFINTTKKFFLPSYIIKDC